MVSLYTYHFLGPSSSIISLINSRTVDSQQRIIHVQTRESIRNVRTNGINILRNDIRACIWTRADDVADEWAVFARRGTLEVLEKDVTDCEGGLLVLAKSPELANGNYVPDTRYKA